MRATDLLAALIRGERLPPETLAELDAAAFCDHAIRHGVTPLVAERLDVDAPPNLRRLFRAEARREATVDLLREVELSRVLAAADQKGIRCLLLKGAHLALSHYPRPELRPRLDTDLLIAERDRDGVDALLRQLGYALEPQVSGEHIKHQRTYVVRHGAAPVHVIDVHWKISNRQVFAGRFSFEELMARARPASPSWPGALAPSNVDALLIACLHRVAHHADVERLIWAYDVHLIVARLQEEEWRAVLQMASDRGLAAVCRAGVEQAVTWFQSPVPADVLADARWSQGAETEPAAAYLNGRTRLQVLADNLRGLPTWSARGRLVREHLFPPADYIRRVYAPESAAPLPLLYAWRVLRGAPVWLGQSLARAGRRTRGRA